MSVLKARLKAARTRGVPVRISCSTACKGTVDLRVDKRTAKRLRLGARTTRVGRASFALAASGKRVVRVRFTSRAKRALARARSVTLTVRAVVASPKGTQRVTLSRKATLKR